MGLPCSKENTPIMTARKHCFWQLVCDFCLKECLLGQEAGFTLHPSMGSNPCRM